MNSHNKSNLYYLSLHSAIVILIFVFVSLCQAQEPEPALGELRLEGEHIEYLVLRRDDGQTEKFDQPAKTLQLPAGEYRLQQVRLEGGYFCDVRVHIRGVNWITISEDKPVVLKVGAPLNQTIEVKRHGRVLELNYKLIGLAGESYIDNQRSKAPGFTIYRGNKEINSGRFEYG